MEIKVNNKKYSVQIKKIPTEFAYYYDLLGICGKHKRRICNVPNHRIKIMTKILVDRLKEDLIADLK